MVTDKLTREQRRKRKLEDKINRRKSIDRTPFPYVPPKKVTIRNVSEGTDSEE